MEWLWSIDRTVGLSNGGSAEDTMTQFAELRRVDLRHINSKSCQQLQGMIFTAIYTVACLFHLCSLLPHTLLPHTLQDFKT